MSRRGQRRATERGVAGARVFGLLARVLRDPDAELFEALRSGRWQAQLAQAAGGSGLARDHPFFSELRRLPENLPADLPSLKAQHAWLFSSGGGCPHQESHYLAANTFQKTDLMADVAGFYAAFGVRTSRERRELPDFLGSELEFLWLLGRKEARALRQGKPEAAAICREAREKFLSEHLAAWIDPYRERVERSAAGPLYVMVARLLECYVRAQRIAPKAACARGLNAT